MNGLELAGTASNVRGRGGRPSSHRGAVLRAATVRGAGGVDAAEGTPRLETVLLDLTGGPGLRVRCGTTLAGAARHARRPPRRRGHDAVRDVRGARARQHPLGSPGTGFAGPGAVVTEHSDYRSVAGHPAARATATSTPASRRDSCGRGRLAARRRGRGDALADTEWPEDRAGLARIADGERRRRRDARSRRVRARAARRAAPAGQPARAIPAPSRAARWALSGGFARERYGSFPFPSTAAGAGARRGRHVLRRRRRPSGGTASRAARGRPWT